jgi:hypothetical protein
MPYTTYLAVNNKYLSDAGDKVGFTSSGDALANMESAERIIRARLNGFIDPTYMATWVDDTTTPELIQEIAAKLTAAFRYRQRASEDLPDGVAGYAQTLYVEAMDMLAAIINGKLDIVEGGLVLSEAGHLNESHFYPNDTVQDWDYDGVKFRMGAVF